MIRIDPGWLAVFDESACGHHRPGRHRLATGRSRRYDGAMNTILLAFLLAVVPPDASLSLQDEALAMIQQADQQLRVGNASGALSLLEQAARRFSTDARVHEALAQVCQQVGQFDRAEQSFRQSVRLDPENGRARWSLGFLLYRADRTAEAQEQLEQAARLLPDQAPVHQAHGLALFAQTRFDEAARALETSARLDPNNAETQYLLGAVRAQLPASDPRSREAEAAFQRTLTLAPSHARAHYQLGLLRLERGDPEEAIPELREATRLQPSLVGAYFSLGNALIRTGQIEAGRRELELFAELESAKRERETLGRLINLQPNKLDLRLKRARMALDQNDLAAALPDVQAALQIDSNQGEAWCLLSEVQLRRGEVSAALSSAEKAYAVGGADAAARRQKARALLRLKRFAEARAELTTLMAGPDQDPELLLLLADALEGLGKDEEAAQRRRQAAELGVGR